MSNATRTFDERFKAATLAEETLKPVGLECVRCWDCGFVWVDCDGVAAWAYCRCKAGKQKALGMPWGLPVYDYEMESLFKAKPFPTKAFVPSSFESFKIGMENKMKLFKNDLKLSEKFWSGK